MLLRNPRAFAFVMAAIGLGLVAFYGEQLWRLPAWNEAEIAQSVELNLALELQRRGPHLQPVGERLEALRRMLRAEVESEIGRERATLQRRVGVGLLLLTFGAGQWLATFLGARAKPH
jgi:hypothetical protein